MHKRQGVELWKNPIFRIVTLTIPVMRRIFQDGDKLAIAMASRCYNEQRTSPVLAASRLDWFYLFTLFCLVILMQFL